VLVSSCGPRARRPAGPDCACGCAGLTEFSVDGM
jgi:hypothetical protein